MQVQMSPLFSVSSFICSLLFSYFLSSPFPFIFLFLSFPYFAYSDLTLALHLQQAISGGFLFLFILKLLWEIIA